jgi:FAD/FMN-containing dehydrogenase
VARTIGVGQMLETTRNVVGYLRSRGRHLHLEGRFDGDRRFRNWSRVIEAEPSAVLRPTGEDELVAAIATAPRLRVVGAGHSFNAGFAGEAMLSLDHHAGIVEVDRAAMTVRARGGTRIRDLSAALAAEGLALAALPSHDAQSAGGILSTDVHGTGRDVGFVSSQVRGLSVVDGTGAVHDVGPHDDLFRAAIGGIGAVGVISEVTFAVVDAFRVAQESTMEPLGKTLERLPELLAAHEHLSLYAFPFGDRCQVNTWGPTTERASRIGPAREAVHLCVDAIAASVLGDVATASGALAPATWVATRARRQRRLVLASYQGFNRSVYHQHQELEIAVDAADAVPALERVAALFRSGYRDRRAGRHPFTVIELRFTPAGHDATLIGPGRGRATCWVDLLTNEVAGFERYFAAAEAALLEMGGRPHLGKWLGKVGPEHLDAAHGDHFRRFLALRDRHDPDRRFANPLTEQLFGP